MQLLWRCLWTKKYPWYWRHPGWWDNWRSSVSQRLHSWHSYIQMPHTWSRMTSASWNHQHEHVPNSTFIQAIKCPPLSLVHQHHLNQPPARGVAPLSTPVAANPVQHSRLHATIAQTWPLLQGVQVPSSTQSSTHGHKSQRTTISPYSNRTSHCIKRLPHP